MTLFKMPSPAPVEVTAEPEALEQRQTLIDVAACITQISTAEDNKIASQWGSAAQKLVKDTKSNGLELRRPYNAAADAVKKFEDDYLAPLLSQILRVSILSAEWRVEQEYKAEAERKARSEAIAVAEEQKRRADEAARLANQLNDYGAAIQADVIAQALEAKKMEAIMAPVPEAAKTEGQSLQGKVLAWECTDAVALWNARPDLCEPPKPKASAIKAVCTPSRPVPGLRLWYESKVNFRSR